MIVTLGDLVEDVVVELGGPINLASDTDARITRRRGGSAANVAATVARLGRGSRFVGQVGDDATGVRLVTELGVDGVDVRFVRRSGRTATIVVLVDEAGERTMLVDRGSARSLTGADPAWLQGADALHLTLYSLIDEPIATTSRHTVRIAHTLGVPVSVDVSSVALIEDTGVAAVRELVASLRPTLVFANADEATALSLDGPLADAAVIVKRGPEPCTVYRPGSDPIDVQATQLDHTVRYDRCRRCVRRRRAVALWVALRPGRGVHVGPSGRPRAARSARTSRVASPHGDLELDLRQARAATARPGAFV